MKVIDAHTHIPGSSFGGRAKSGDELREDFRGQGLSGAWVMPLDGLLEDPERNNDALAEQVSNHRDFFVPFCTVSPLKGEGIGIRELERAARDLGMRGLKLHPWLQSFSLTHPAAVPILRKAGELGLPVLFHDGTPPYSTPLQIAWAAEQAPGTTFILGHSGLDDLYQDAILACLRHENVYMCLCSPSAGYMREIIHRCPEERLLFGSDAGFSPIVVQPAIAKVREACEDDGFLEQVFFGNAQRLLPLEENGR